MSRATNLSPIHIQLHNFHVIKVTLIGKERDLHLKVRELNANLIARRHVNGPRTVRVVGIVVGEIGRFNHSSEATQLAVANGAVLQTETAPRIRGIGFEGDEGGVASRREIEWRSWLNANGAICKTPLRPSVQHIHRIEAVVASLKVNFIESDLQG